MSLVVETGLNIVNANSYIAVADVRELLSGRGITVSDDDDVVSAVLYRGMDEIESLSFAGTRSNDGQSLSWPRSGVSVDGVEIAADAIPAQLTKALAFFYDYAANRAVDTAAIATPFVKKQKVDVIEQEFSDKHIRDGDGNDGLSHTGIMDLPLVAALLKPLLSTGSASGYGSGHIDLA